MDRDYLSDHGVDKFNLDIEYENHPSTYMHWAEQAVNAHIERVTIEEQMKLIKAETKKELEEVRAEIDIDIRLNFESKYGFDKKPTEAAITATIVQTDKYKEKDKEGIEKVKKIFDQWIDAVKNEQILDEVRRTMAFKKSSIEGLERLVLREYYPRFSKDIQEPLDKEGKERRKEILQEERKTIRRRKSKSNKEE